MDLTFTDDQRAICELADSIFADFCGDERLRRLDAEGAAFDEELWRHFGEAGLLEMLRAPGDEAGFGMVETMMVLERQGRHASRLPLWRHLLAGAALRGSVHPSPRLATLAIDDQLSDLTASIRDGGWQINGTVRSVALARDADWLIVTAFVDAEPHLFAMPLDRDAMDLVDGTLTDGEQVCDIHVKAKRLPGWARLDRSIEEWISPRAVACLAALQLGVAEEALARTARYVSERQQFGRPIGTFQAVAVRAADAYVDVEALRAAVWRLCWAIDAGVATVSDIEVAKIWAADCGHRVAHTAQHLHGGLGADRSYPLHRFYLQARALEMTSGGTLAHRRRLGDYLADADPDAVFNDG